MRIEELTDKEEKKSFVKCSLSDIENLLHLYKE